MVSFSASNSMSIDYSSAQEKLQNPEVHNCHHKSLFWPNSCLYNLFV